MQLHSLADILSQQPQLVLVDAYGVLYGDDGVFPGVSEAVQEVQRRHIPIMVVTNNTYHSPEGISRRLNEMGIEIPSEQILSSGIGLSADSELRQLLQNKRVYVFGSHESRFYVDQVPGAIVVDRVLEAQVVVLAATVDEQIAMFNTLMADLAEWSVPVVCCNPDRYVMGTNGRWPVIGYYADRLAEELSLPVLFVGKPHVNFSKIVADFLKVRYNLSSFSGVFFFDDNPDNVRQLSRDIGIRGVLVQDTGLACEIAQHEIETYQLEFAVPAFRIG